MGSWNKLNNKTWSCVYSYTIDGKNKQKRFSYPGLTKRQAEIEYAKDIASFKPTLKKHMMTISDLVDKWLEQKQYDNISDGTIFDYKRLCRYIKDSEIADIPLMKITQDNLQDYINKLGSDGKSPKYIQQYGLILKPAFIYAMKRNLIIVNPIIDVTFPKVKKSTVTVIEEDKLPEVLSLINENPCKLALMILFHTAMRRGEVCALQWQDINFKNQTMKISKSLRYIDKQWILKGTKSDREREIAISDYLYDMLKVAYKNRKSKVWVCSVDGNNHLSPNALYEQYSKIAKKLEVSTKLHDIRHTVITAMINADMNIKAVSEIAGHANIQMTLDRYTHLNTDKQRKAVNVMSAFSQKK